MRFRRAFSVRSWRRRTWAILALAIVTSSFAGFAAIPYYLPFDESRFVIQKDAVPVAYTPAPIPTVVPGSVYTFYDGDHGRKGTSGTIAQLAGTCQSDYRLEPTPCLAKAFGGQGGSAFAEVGKKFVAGGTGYVMISAWGHIRGVVIISGLGWAKLRFVIKITDLTNNVDIYYDEFRTLYRTVLGQDNVDENFTKGTDRAYLITGHTYVVIVAVSAESVGASSYMAGMADALSTYGGQQYGIWYNGITITRTPLGGGPGRPK